MPYFLNRRLMRSAIQSGGIGQDKSLSTLFKPQSTTTFKTLNQPLLFRTRPLLTQIPLRKEADFTAKTAIGVSLFRGLVEESTVFVDKTLFIRDFFEGVGKVKLFTYPRRWGKSVNLDMIKTFAEIEVDGNGRKLADKDKINPKLFSHGKLLGQGGEKGSLKIFSETKLVKKHMGKYPVISISFKGVHGRDFTALEKEMRFVIQELYKNYRYLLHSPKVAKDDKGLIKRYQLGTVDTAELKNSLLILARLLHQHFGQKVIVLVDEYDAPINYAYQTFSMQANHTNISNTVMQANDTDISDTMWLIRDLLGNVLKGADDYVHQGLVTGILRVAKADIFSGLNNPKEFNILNEKYSVYYGFTEKEVNDLLDSYGVPAELRGAIKGWYNGYNVGKLQIYNPWSIVNCLSDWQDNKEGSLIEIQKRILQSYWEESGSINYLNNIFKMPLIRKKLEQLISGFPLSFNLYKSLSANEFTTIRTLANAGSNYELNQESIDIFFSYLFTAGYLTKDLKTERFKIPNYEIRLEFERKILAFYSKKYNIGMNFFESVTDAVQAHLDSENPDENIEEFKKGLTNSFQKLLAQFPKFEKLSGERINDQGDTQQIIHANEDVIHSIMNYIVLQVKTMSKFATELPVHGKRADVILIDSKNNKAIIIELKYDGSAEDALEQIQERQYAQDINHKLDATIVGLNVDKDKKVSIVAKYLQQGTLDKNIDSVISGFETKFRPRMAV